MADKDSSVSCYLLRPPRSFEQVLGGRNRAMRAPSDHS